MESPLTWGPVEKKIYEAKKAWDKAHADGLIGYSYPAYIALELRRAELLNETTVDDLVKTDSAAIAEAAVRDAIAKLLTECSSEQLGLIGRTYPHLGRDDLSEAYDLLIRTVVKNRAKAENTTEEPKKAPAPFGNRL